MVNNGANAGFDIRNNNITCGMIIGNPNTAIIAAFCCALAAMAARKVKTRLKLQPPRRTNPIKGPALTSGLPKKIKKRRRLIPLISSISKELNNNLARTKWEGLARE